MSVKTEKIATTRTRLKIAFSGIKKKDSEKIMSFSYSPMCYGFTFRGGVLKSDSGFDYAYAGYYVENGLVHNFQPFPPTVKIVNAFVYRKTNSDGSYNDRIVVQTDENLLYQTELFTSADWTCVSGVAFSGKTCAVCYNYNGNDTLLLCSPEHDLTILNDQTTTTVPLAPRFSSMCAHYERIFATDSTKKNSVWFSDDFNPSNWVADTEQGGFITFADEAGSVLKVVSFLDYVYIFREHGIFRLSAYADQSEFSVSQVFVATGRIFGDTVAQYGDRIIFFAEDGLYKFDGYDVVKIAEDLPETELKSYACGAAFQGKYYLACRIAELVTEENSSMTNNSLVEYDVATGVFSILCGVDILKLLPVNVHHVSEMIAVFRSGKTNFLGTMTSDGEIFGTSAAKYWKSPANTLGTEKKKVVREVRVTSSASAVLGVNADGESYEFPIKGGAAQQKIIVGKAGDEIGFYIKSSCSEIEIAPPVVIIDLV